MDVVGGAGALLALSPLLLLTAVAVRLTSPGPIFYHWRVIGRGGRPFVGYKFRSMVVGAEEQKPALMKFNEMTGPVFKMRDDPRITPVGRLIRKFSLDEMPQLWSVIKGDMSLVGPRPVAPHEWEKFEPWQRRKLSVTPGMICLWHVEGKPFLFEQWIKLDLEYIDRWSLWLDVKILLRGIGYILGGRSV
jgi:lipopolysaccharide/colanic/teichoic acid biosynthesis glycosyltransferase